MSKAYAKTRTKKNTQTATTSKQQAEQQYQQNLIRAYNTAADLHRQDVRELAQQTRGLASKMDTYDSRGTYLRNRQGVNEYNEDLENYKAKLRQLGSYGYDTSSALKAAQRNTIGVKSVGKTSFTKDVVSSLNPKVVNPRETIIGRITGSADKKFQNAVNAELTRRRYQESGQKMPGVGNGSIGSNIAAMQTGRAPNRLESLFNSASAGYRSGMLGTVAAVTGKQDLNTSDADMTFRAGRIGDTSGYELPWISKIKSKISKWAGEQADVLDQESQDSMTLAKDGLGTFGSMLVDAGIAGTQMAMDFGVSALSGGAVNSLGVMGTRVFGQANREAKRNGATDDQAFDYALGSAAVEVLTEKIGNVAAPFAAAYGAGTLDEFIKQGIKNAAKTKAGRLALTTLTSAVSEGSEELISGLMNPLLEAATYGGADALRQFQSPDFWTNLAHDFAVGALMGGFGMAGDAVSVASQQMRQNAADRSLGRTITEAEYTQRLMEANVIQQNQRAGEIAAQLQKAKSGSRRADLLTGRLYNAVNEGETQTAMANRLVTLGVDAEAANTIASGIQNELNGIGATRAELAAMQQYEKQTNRVRTEYEDALEGDDQSSNQWARELDSQQFGRAMDISFAAAERAQRAEEGTTEEAPKAETLAVNEQEGVQNNGQSVLPGGSQRYDGQSAGREVRQLEEGAGRDQSRETWGRPADREIAQSAAPAQKTVSSRQIHPAGIESDSIYQPEYRTEKMKRAEEWAQQHGKKAVFFAGDMLTVQHTMPDGSVDNVRVRGMIDGDTIYLRADDAQFTSEQIAKHETTHDLLDTGRISRAAVRTALQARYTPEEIDNICHMYAEAFAGMTDAEAFDEIICDSIGGMNIFARSDAQGKGALFRDILNSVYEEAQANYGKGGVRYEGRTADSEMRSGARFSQEQSGETPTEQALAGVGIAYDEKSESASPSMLRFSRETWLNSEYVQNRQEAAQKLADALGIGKRKALQYINNVNSIAKMIADDQARLDYEASPGRSAFVSNVEYGGSIDFSTVCKKRRLYTGTVEAIQRLFPNRYLTSDELLRIRSYMKDQGYEVACGFCYVEGSRVKIGKYTQQFLDEYRASGAEYVPTMAEMNTATGQEVIRREHPEVYDAYVKFMNKLAQRKPKLFQLATAYDGEILDKFLGKEESVEDKNDAGGLRLQSYSDFEIIHLIDCMQVIMDMSRVGLAGQAYTKVPEFAWALGGTGLKINLSVIAKGVDADGNLIFDDVEGMPWDEAMKLRNAYSKNVGTIIVVFDDAQLKAAMADDRIDFIIPFHRSQWSKKDYGKMGLAETTKDYTSKQNERYIKPVYGKKRDGSLKKLRAENYAPNTYWDFKKSGKENAEEYLRMCARDNKRPKFYQLLVNNGDGSYSLQPDGSTDGYWKLLIDFKMYDNKGKGSEQLPVRPDFNMEQARKMLDEYTGGHEKFPVAQDVVDHFAEELGGQKHFSREMDSDYMAAVERGDMEAAQRMVDEAARAAGYDSPKLYHGTNAFGFTVIDTKKSNDRFSFFATNSADVAGTYSGTKEAREISTASGGTNDAGMYQLYANTDGMIEFDANGAESNHIALGKYATDFNERQGRSPLYDSATAKQIAKYAKSAGYPGVIIRNVIDTATPDSRTASNAADVYVFFEPKQQTKSADPVTYDNDGNVIPLSERFNSEKTDIRFSREATNLREANREIEKLRTMAEYWKGQTQRTTRENAGPNEKDVLDVAKALIADYGSSEDPQSIRADIRELARYIMRGEPKTHDVRFETVSDMAYRIAQKVVEPTMEVEPFDGMGEQIRKDLRDANIDMTTVKGDFAEGWREVMQITRGKIKNKKGGAGIDTFWMEMQERYGTGVFPEDITNPADQLRYMAELYDQTQTQEIRKLESAYYEEVMWCRNDIIDKVLGEEIRQNPPTKMDKALEKADESKRRAVTRERERMDAAVEKEREKRLGAVASERERASERLDSAVGREREKRLNAVERERERRDVAVDRERERGREAVARERERGRYNTEKAKWEMALRDNAAMRRKQEQLARQAEKFAKEKKDYAEKARKVKNEALERQERQLKEHFREVQRNQRERRSKSALWKRILAKKNDFLQLKAKPGQAASRHAPAELANALAAVADCFNIENRKRTVNAKGLTKSLADLSKVYEAMKGDERNGVYYDEGLADFLKQTATAFGSFEADALTLDELERMDKLLRSFHHTITHANQFMTRKWAIGLIEAGRKWTREVMEAAPVLKGLAGDLLNFQLRPDSFFARLSGFAKNSVGEQVQKMFADSTERMLTVQRAFYQHFREYSEDKRFDKLTARGKKDLVDVGLKDTDGNKVLLTRDMMLAVYKHLSSQDNLEAAAYGGLEIPDLDKYYTGKVAAAFDAHRKTAHADYNLYEIQQQLRGQQDLAKNAETEADRAAAEEAAEQLEEQIRKAREESLQTMLDVRANISKMLTDYEKKLIEASELWMDQSAAYINEVTMNMYGFEKANVPKYWPMHRDTNFVQTDMRNAVDEINLENWGSLKERVKSHAPIKLTGFIFELDNHTVKMSRYYGFAEAQRDFNKLYNTQLPSARSSLAEQVQKKFGSSNRKLGVSGQQYIDAYLASISGANEVNTSFFSLIRRNLPRATLTINLRVAVSQLASIPTAAGEIGWGAMLKGMPRGFKTAFSTKAKNELAEKNVWFWQRYRGEGGMREFADMKEEQNWFDRGWNKLAGTKVGKVLFNWCQDFDVFATASMWAMSEEYVKSNTDLKPGTEEFDRRVGEVYRDVIRKTQPNYTETERSDLLRDKREGMKFLTMYKTQSNQNLNILYESSARFAQYKRDLKNGKNGVTKADVDQAGKQLARAYTSVLLGGTLAFSILRAAANAILHNMNAYRDDDDEVTLEGILNGILDETIGAFAGMFAFGSEIESVVMAIIKKEKYWGLTDSAVSALSDLLEKSVDAIQKATDADKDLSRDDVEKLVKTWAQILGIPYDNGKKIYEGVWGHIEDIQNGEFLSFESGVKRTGKTEAKKLVDAMLDGDKEKAEKAWEHLLETKADKKDPEGTAQDAVKNHLKDLYFDDEINEKQMKKLLKTFGWDDSAKIDEFVTGAKCKKETGYYPGKLKEGYLDGAFGDKKAIQYLKEYNGKDADEAEETLNYWKMNKKYGFDYNDTGDMYAKGKISEKEAKTILMTYGDYSEEDADDKVLKWGVNKEYGFDYDDTREQYVKGNISGEEAAEIWSKYGGMEDEKIADRLLTADFLAEHPEVDEDNVTANRVELYDLIGKGANIPADKFMEYAKKVKTFHGEVDAKGKSIPYSTQDKIIAWIDTLDLSPAQKTAVFATYFDEGKIPTNSYKRIKW